MIESEYILAAGLLLVAGLAASVLAGRLRLPSLVLFLAVGMLLGDDGIGLVSFDDYELARILGVVALALIIFEGGLAAGYDEIRPVLWNALSLSLVGTLVTALVTGLAAAWLLELPTLEGMLLGAVVASTDAAAIFALLRGSTLRRRLARTLEGEAGSNDPVAVLLVLGFIEWLQQPDYGPADMVVLLVQQLGIGAAVGVGVGFVAARAFRSVRFDQSGLYPVASLAAAAVAYGAAAVVDGSGFLAVYLAGLVLGSSTIPARRTVTAFHSGLAWVAQLSMFLTLGLLVFPSELGTVALDSIALALVLAFVARPVATMVSTAFTRYGVAERVVLAWAGLRGAVPVVLATFPVIAGIPRSEEFFNIVFFAVLLTTLVQGVTFEPLARRLGMTTTEPALPEPLAESGVIRRLGAEVVEYRVAPTDAIVGVRVRDLGLPREALVNVIVREGQAVPPRGSTRVHANDALHLLVREEAARETEEVVSRWAAGPVGPRPAAAPPPVGRARPFHARPWTERDGDAARPRSVAGREVVDQLRTRHDEPGALVLLADGSYAVTGPTLALGGRRQVTRWARRRLGLAASDAERSWWEQVIGAVAR